MNNPRILVLYTGGTIGMQASPAGLVPVTGYFENYMRNCPELTAADLPDYDFVEFSPLLDSSRMGPDDWNHIACHIRDYSSPYDGVLVLHGTDTLAYTSSALSFMLQGLSIPVVLTGSMLPAQAENSDAAANILTSLRSFCSDLHPGVYVVFHGTILPGAHVTKVDACGPDAFTSPFPVDISSLPAVAPTKKLSIFPASDVGIDVVYLIPGFSAATLAAAASSQSRALVLRTFGNGNSPDSAEFLHHLKQAADRGKLIINQSQCMRSLVDMSLYGAGEELSRLGVIGSGTMTLEATVTKLNILLTRFQEAETILSEFRRPWNMEYPAPDISN